MRDRNDSARIVVEEVFEPCDRLGVEMVGGLVEQQQIRSTQQQLAERDAPPFAARQRGHRRIPRRAAERVHRHLDLRVELPGANLVDAVLHAALFREHLVHFVG